MGHRYYDSSTGRFITRDPIQDGDNWYIYCENNPVDSIDADGFQKFKINPRDVIKGAKEFLKWVKDRLKKSTPAKPKGSTQKGPQVGKPISSTAPGKGKSTIHNDKQGKHIPGHKNFDPTKSRLTHKDPQALINKHQGKGRKIVSGNAVKERIDFKEVIGEVLDPKTGKWVKLLMVWSTQPVMELFTSSQFCHDKAGCRQGYFPNKRV